VTGTALRGWLVSCESCGPGSLPAEIMMMALCYQVQSDGDVVMGRVRVDEIVENCCITAFRISFRE
jgi:hypothetical protein